MLICLHYCAKDYEQASRLAEWLGELGPFPNHDLLLMRDRRAPKSLEVMFGFANFKTQNEVVITDDVANSWPASSNHAFKKIAKYVQYVLGGVPFLHIEPDAVILRASAFDEIEDEYARARARAAKQVFLGDLIDHRGNKPGAAFIPHMSGIGVFPGNLTRYAGEVFQADETTPWDIVAGPAIYAQAMQSELIFHWWNREGQGLAPFTSWPDVEAKIFARRPKCALFHSAKDESLIRLLRERKNFSGREEASSATDASQDETLPSTPDVVENNRGCSRVVPDCGSSAPPAENNLHEPKLLLKHVATSLKDANETVIVEPTSEIPSARIAPEPPLLKFQEFPHVKDIRIEFWPDDQRPWESRESSIAEIRQLAARLKQFQTSSPRVKFVRELLHQAGVIELAYRYKRRKGWKRKRGAP